MSKNNAAGLAHAKKLIKKCLKTQATFLDLGKCGLMDLSELPELWECTHLEGLNLGSWYWKDGKELNSKNGFTQNKIGDEEARLIVKNVIQFTFMELGLNKIGDEGARLITENLKQLTSLYLKNNEIGDEGAKQIAENLQQLTFLDLGDNQIGDEGVRHFEGNLKQLTSLYFGSNQIGAEGARRIAENLKQLTSLDLGDNEIGDEGVRHFEGNLKQLTSLDLSNNTIGTEGAKHIAENLKQLTSLSLSSNKIGDAGARHIAENVKQLTSLDLSFNEIGDAGAIHIAEKMQHLFSLNLSGNNITTFRPFLQVLHTKPDLPLLIEDVFDNEGLNLTNNAFIEPPREVVKQGKEAILEYFRQKELSGSQLLLEAKMVLLGDGRAGKTSLACRLLGKALPKEKDRTKGVDILIGDYTFTVDEGDFTLNIWDFAGQDRYKPLHQFFYSESTLYVLVADSGNGQTDYADWFETANLYGGGSPLIVVLNEFSDGVGYGTFAEDHWKTQFPSLIKDVHLVNLLKQKDISTLERDIKHHARQLPHVQSEYPTNWANIRAELERRRDKNVISFQEYLRICKDNNLPERNSALILSSVLHKIGVCLHYQKSELLSQHIILKNEWATNAVYKILEDHSLSEVKKGFFDMDDLRRIWSDTEYQDMIPQLLALMCEFKLAYPLPIKNEYVAPPLLPQAQPRDIELSEDHAIQVMVEFEFLPKALMTQFIVSKHMDIDNKRTLVWRDGVVLCWPSNTRAIIRKIKSRGRDAFQILVAGTEQRGLLTSIVKTLRDLCEEYPGIRVQEIVKCPCAGCQSGKNEQHFFDFKKLTKRLENKKRTTECEESYEEIDLIKMLGNLFIFENIGVGELIELKDVKKELKTIKIFLASSSELAEDRDDFDLYFRQQNDHLKDAGIYLKIVRWENFLDAMSETKLQDEYNKEVRACDIFVSLFFTKTGKFTEEEFDVAHQQFKDSGGVKPQIFTFFKNADIKTGSITKEVNTLLSFQEKLKGLGHYYTQYDNIADLKLQFRDQLKILIRQTSKNL